MHRVLPVVCLVASAILIGCSQRPPVLTEVQDSQRKLIATKQWRGLADRAVSALLCRPDTVDPSAAPHCTTDLPIYISATSPNMPFSDAFRTYLTQSLLDHGLPVATTAQGANAIKFHVQPYLFDQETGDRHPFNQWTLWSTVGAAGWTAAEVGLSTGAGIAGVAVAGPILDFLEGMASRTDAEVVISVALERHGTISKLTTEEFYVHVRDVFPGGLYWSNFSSDLFDSPNLIRSAPQPRTIRVSSE